MNRSQAGARFGAAASLLAIAQQSQSRLTRRQTAVRGAQFSKQCGRRLFPKCRLSHQQTFYQF